jgi:multidrug efflux pump subunit AcrA (membrane-fusion protein)
MTISAEVAGRITKKTDPCRAGKTVRAGDLLFEIDRRDYELQQQRLQEEQIQAAVALQELDVEVSDTRSLLELAEVDLELQEDELQRRKDVAMKGVITETDLDTAKRSVIQSRTNLLNLKSQLNLLNTRRARLQSAEKLIQVQLEQAKINLARTRLVAPVDGVVVTEHVEENSYVQKGTPLVTIEDTAAVEVKCKLRADQMAWIWSQRGRPHSPDSRDGEQETSEYELPQTPVTVTYRLDGRETTWDGLLWRYDGIGLDQQTRTVPCRVLVTSPKTRPDPDQRRRTNIGPPALVRGMYVTLKIHTQPRAELLRVPERALQPGNKVYRVRKGVLFSVSVQIVETGQDHVIVHASSEDLHPGDQVVVSPLADVIEGMPVRDRAANGQVALAPAATGETEEASR